ncbi:hypothetical protein A1O1_08865 [Capronia coronata CBS 617.96]|uniref:Xylanolytic transcriptional activator regulatory domain-containing protein n=1 Tax=Capronia coronata CBS 617.96 TaxID=1182541 RepID=W9XMB5_9EURO|nr:uncharacterized protein A1O1_08865 [Capronia coronata CBS 617.96]EXJ78465.1 hypothetical protein A1O1_08865 [Capronia coronata CBS 617.96]
MKVPPLTNPYHNLEQSSNDLYDNVRSPSLEPVSKGQGYEAGSVRGRVATSPDSVNLTSNNDALGSNADYQSWNEKLHRFAAKGLDLDTQQFLQKGRQKDFEELQKMGAFVKPSDEFSDALLQSFFRYVHPVHPILCRSTVLESYKSDQLSPLLLNAIFLVGVSHVPECLYKAAGFKSRYIANVTFYLRAKALYDANYEQDSITTLQALVLMSHWWGGLTEPKSSLYWLGVAAVLAESLRMHKAESYVNLSPNVRRVRRRLWWVIFTNDTYTAAVLKKPRHLHESFCNVPPLSEDDFVDTTLMDSPSEVVSSTSIAYLIHFTSLNLKVSRYLDSQDASGSWQHADTLWQDASLWEASLPPELRYRSLHRVTPEDPWWLLLHLCYNTFQIALPRPQAETTSHFGVGTAQFIAAATITRSLEDIHAFDLLDTFPIFVYAKSQHNSILKYRRC